MTKLTAFLVILCMAACKSPGASELKHDVGQPTWFGAFDFYDMDFAEYTRRTQGPFLSEDHRLTLYVQGWLDHFDQVLRQRFPGELAGIPAPRGAVRKVPQVGAFTMGSKNVCFKVPLRISPDVPIESGTTLAGVTADGGRLSPAYGNMCQDIVVPPERYAEFAVWYSERFAPCQLTYREGEEYPLVMTGPCREEDFFPGRSFSDTLHTKIAPNRILVFAGTLLTLQSEEELVATLAHELGHYYRGHVIHQDRYDYCYKISDENHGHRPEPDPSLDDLCDRLSPRLNFSVEEAAERRLGYYTIEQEADELALEFMSLVGVDPKKAVDAWFNLAAGFDRDTNSAEIPWRECKELRDRGWRNEQGQPVFVPVGDYRDPHHSWCYRIRNTDREIAAHAYEISPRTKAVMAWDDIQAWTREEL